MDELPDHPIFLSVVLNAYNEEAFLPEAIESVLAQSYPYFELILGNDGSCDRTLEIMQAYAARDDRIRIVDQPNTGVAGIINRCVQAARYAWIVHLDGDDRMLPRRLERQLAFIQANPDLVCAATQIYKIDPHGRRLGVTCDGPRSRAEFRQKMLKNRMLVFAHTTVIFRRDIYQRIGGYRKFAIGCDLDFFNRMSECGTVLVQDEVLTEQRKHSESVTSQRLDVMLMEMHIHQHNILARRTGKPELNTLEFNEYKKELSFGGRLALQLEAWAFFHYKKGSLALANRQQVLFLLHMLIWAALSPGSAIQKFRTRKIRL